jgi:hypothetical protein
MILNDAASIISQRRSKLWCHLPLLLTTLANAKVKAKHYLNTIIVQASLMIITYNHQNIFIVQATGHQILCITILI